MGEQQKQSWIDWRVFWSVMITLIVVLPLLAFLVQRGLGTPVGVSTDSGVIRAGPAAVPSKVPPKHQPTGTKASSGSSQTTTVHAR